MAKVCLKCGYERKPEDPEPDWSCPQCGAVYAKLEAQKSEQESLQSTPVGPRTTRPVATGSGFGLGWLVLIILGLGIGYVIVNKDAIWESLMSQAQRDYSAPQLVVTEFGCQPTMRGTIEVHGKVRSISDYKLNLRVEVTARSFSESEKNTTKGVVLPSPLKPGANGWFSTELSLVTDEDVGECLIVGFSEFHGNNEIAYEDETF